MTPTTCPAFALDQLDLKARDQKTLQIREGEDPDAIARYAEAYREGGSEALPAIAIMRDAGGVHWLTDGWHRVKAARKAGLTALPAKISDGDIRSATLAALGANGTHGLPLSLDERKRAVTGLLEDAEWRQWSDARIAKHCHVSPQLVAKLRKNIPGAQVEERVRVDGSTRKKPANGRAKAIAEAPAQEAVALTVGRASHSAVVLRHIAIRDRAEFKGMHPIKVMILIALDLAGQAVDRTTLAALVCPALDVHPGQLRKAGLIHGDNQGYTLSDEGRALMADPASATAPAQEPEDVTLAAEAPSIQAEVNGKPVVLVPAWKQDQPALGIPHTRAERIAIRQRELILDQLKNGKPRWKGHDKELLLLALLLGINTHGQLNWHKAADIDQAEPAFHFDLLEGCLDAYARQCPPRLPDLEALCRIWNLDHDTLRIQAERCLPE